MTWHLRQSQSLHYIVIIMTLEHYFKGLDPGQKTEKCERLQVKVTQAFLSNVVKFQFLKNALIRTNYNVLPYNMSQIN